MKKESGRLSEVELNSTRASSFTDHTHPFAKALSKIGTADAASSRGAIQAAKATKPSLHTRFVHDPVKDRA